MSTQPKPFLSPKEYLELEAAAERKSEYYNGEMFLMAGASKRHVLITDNLTRALGNLLDDKPCTPYSSDLRLWIAPLRLYTYPDLMIACEQEEAAPDDPDSLVNPTAIIEVLSPSTEVYDRGKKFGHYLHIPSLRDYILVSQEEVRVDHYIIRPGGSHTFRCLQDPSDTLDILSINCSLPLCDIYRRTELAS
jgi:Uma2 family endonuclease